MVDTSIPQARLGKSPLERRLAEAFDVFDYTMGRSINTTDLGAVIRSLGLCPTEAEIQEIIEEIEDKETVGIINRDNFISVMIRIVDEKRMNPASADTLLKAFRMLDPENRGYLEPDQFTKLMMEKGEPFSEEEIAEMLNVAVDRDTEKIPYEYYINQLLGKSTRGNIYKLGKTQTRDDDRRNMAVSLSRTASKFLSSLSLRSHQSLQEAFPDDDGRDLGLNKSVMVDVHEDAEDIKKSQVQIIESDPEL